MNTYRNIKIWFLQYVQKKFNWTWLNYMTEYLIRDTISSIVAYEN